MFIESRDFEAWMKRIMERFDRLENRMDEPDEQAKAEIIDGKRLYDKSKVTFKKTAGKIVLPKDKLIDGTLQFARTPFSVAFQAE